MSLALGIDPGTATTGYGLVRVESDGSLPGRSARAVANRLGTEAVIFPSGHSGFMGGEYGQTGDPDAFAEKLREVFAG